MTVTPRPAPMLRRDLLREALPASVGLLAHCRAADIPEGYIDDYVALDWLEWHGGSLRLTITGANMCRQVKARP